MNATRKKIRLTLEIEVTAPVGEDHERAAWTAAIGVTPTLPGVAFGPADVVGIETEDEPCRKPEVEVIRSLADETWTAPHSLVHTKWEYATRIGHLSAN